MKGDVQKAILKQLLYNDKMRYNELWNKEFSSNLFDYHLKKLIEDGIVAKQDDLYSLTAKGTQHISYLDGKTIEQKQRPLVCTFLLGLNDKGELLMHRRKKQPFLNYVGLPGGKLEMGERVEEQAIQEFLEETGFTAMDRTTAYPASIIAIMLAKGQVEKGAIRLEAGVPGDIFVNELQKRGIKLIETIKTEL